MLIAIHLADFTERDVFRYVRQPPRPDRVPGLRWATAAMPVRLGRVPPRPVRGRVGLISAWNRDEDLDDFLAAGAWGSYLAHGYEVRLAPMQASGSWRALPELAHGCDPGVPEEPVGVLTLGRLRLSQTVRFLRASAAAEHRLLGQPSLLAATGLARPPFLSTFSLWKTVTAMREYAYGPAGHAAAIARHKARPFHHESVFARLRPYRSSGHWDGRDPLAEVELPGAP
jgi:hypothetical protein